MPVRVRELTLRPDAALKFPFVIVRMTTADAGFFRPLLVRYLEYESGRSAYRVKAMIAEVYL